MPLINLGNPTALIWAATSFIPALTLLVSLGWNFLSPAQALASREHKTSNVVLKNILREELKKRHFHYAGKDYPLSEKAIDTLLSEVCNPALNEGLGVANERIYNHMLYGITVTECGHVAQ